MLWRLFHAQRAKLLQTDVKCVRIVLKLRARLLNFSIQQHYSLYWCVRVSSYLWRSQAGRERSPPPPSRPTASACSPFSFSFIKESRKAAPGPALDYTADSAERHRAWVDQVVHCGGRGRETERERESVGGGGWVLVEGWGGEEVQCTVREAKRNIYNCTYNVAFTASRTYGTWADWRHLSWVNRVYTRYDLIHCLSLHHVGVVVISPPKFFFFPSRHNFCFISLYSAVKQNDWMVKLKLAHHSLWFW